MQQKPLIIAAASIAALLSLAACDQQTVTANTAVDPQANALAKAAPVELPPAIQASRTYRCKDNSLVYIDFYTNDTAMVRKERGGEAVTLTATEGNPPYTAEGYSLSANADSISLTQPGSGTQSCNA